jgi:multidrug efflux system membrane fusion protein
MGGVGKSEVQLSRIVLMISGVLGGVVVAGLVGFGSGAARSAPEPTTPASVPVKAIAAKAQDVPVLLRGIGSVQAFNVVQIKSQVTGNLIAIPVKEGQEVKAGTIVAQIDPRPFQAALDQATAQRQGDAASLQSQQADLKRYAQLARSSFAPIQQVDDQQATVGKTTAAIAADAAAIETAQINLQYATIHSPINGRVSIYQTDPGNLIEANSTPIITITQDHPIAVIFTLPEADLPQIQDAMEATTLPVSAYTSDDKTLLGQGVLETPNNTIDTTTGTIQLKAIFANDRDRLWPGEFVNARLQVDTLRNVVTVPQVAIQHGPTGLFVYTIQPDQTVRQQSVETGYDDGQIAVVTKGLQAGEKLVLEGQSRLSPGVHVASGER